MENVEKEIALKVAKANSLSVRKLGLRFDRVVVRLLGNLRAYVEQASPYSGAILFTITAPIKLPGKTEQAVKERIGDMLKHGSPADNINANIFENQVHLKIINCSLKEPAKFVGLVHNPGTDAELLINLAERWLTDCGPAFSPCASQYPRSH